MAHCVRNSPTAGRLSAWVDTLLLKNLEEAASEATPMRPCAGVVNQPEADTEPRETEKQRERRRAAESSRERQRLPRLPRLTPGCPRCPGCPSCPELTRLPQAAPGLPMLPKLPKLPKRNVPRTVPVNRGSDKPFLRSRPRGHADC